MKKETSNMPDWLLETENYIPESDQDTFVNKSILSLLKVIARIKSQDQEKQAKLQVNVTLHVAFTFILLILLSLSRSFIFVIVINVYLLLILSAMDAEKIVKILKVSIGVSFFTFLVMVPAIFWGNHFSSIMITSKAFATVTAVGILSHSTKWGTITSAFKRFMVPDIFILVLDITIKYIVMLGEFALNMLYALKLRSIGRNKSKYTSLSGIAGNMFIKSKEMAEDMYQAMECRGFTGEYHVYYKSRFQYIDYIYLIVNVAIFILFFYFQNI
ncbi:energy-coupling factor transporter transmembrane component T [Anaeromicropila herbilytica]|uniref:Cobalt permease n=1 Tax=Anaeromicropila herbilytica TaxID=2785025 RepID=A0A7R7EIF2_9FIRM|nr:energy-coupling factor transporter transmembrane component T [Anaeromicropila herbilytica]BCN29353.1 cobalt permease [Anaeromicropila herbilytica]